jgi:hypothetical protein
MHSKFTIENLTEIQQMLNNNFNTLQIAKHFFGDNLLSKDYKTVATIVRAFFDNRNSGKNKYPELQKAADEAIDAGKNKIEAISDIIGLEAETVEKVIYLNTVIMAKLRENNKIKFPKETIVKQNYGM